MCDLAITGRKAHRLRARQLTGRQRLHAAGENLHRSTGPFDGKYRWRSFRSASDTEYVGLAGGQLAATGEIRCQLSPAAIGSVLEQPAITIDHMRQQQAATSQWQVAGGAQLPGCRGTIEVLCRVRLAGRRQRMPMQLAVCLIARLPETQTVAEAEQPAVGGEAWLLQGLASIRACQALPVAPTLVRQAFSCAQARRGPRLFGTIPFDPSQPCTVRTEHRSGIEVGALHNNTTRTIDHGDTHQTMHDANGLTGFLQRQNRITDGIMLQIAITAFRRRGQRDWRRGLGVIGQLQVDLLICLVDEGDALTGQTERAAAVFIDATAYREAVRGQAACAASLPEPQRAAPLNGVVLDPEQPPVTGPQLGIVLAGGRGGLGAPGAGPETVGQHLGGWVKHARIVAGRFHTLRMSLEAFSLRCCS